MLKNKFKINPTEERGFTFIEVIVATGIMAIVILMFGTMLISSADLQKRIFVTQSVDRALAYESEQVNSIRWDNLMLKPEPFAICDIDSKRISTQSIDPGPNLIVYDNLEISITREITWANSNAVVDCSPANKNRIEPKRISITASWLDGNEVNTKVLDIIRSKWAEAPIENINAPDSGVALFYEDTLSQANTWCQSYIYEGVITNPGEASLLPSGNLDIAIVDTNAICGREIVGLEPGRIYTVVAEVTLMTDSTPLTLTSEGDLLGAGIVSESNQTARLSYNFISDSETRLVGLKKPTNAEFLPNSRAVLSEFKIYVSSD
jgi:prepilin-type N-terminal cleavage/methylation domain-containing protein